MRPVDFTSVAMKGEGWMTPMFVSAAIVSAVMTVFPQAAFADPPAPISSGSDLPAIHYDRPSFAVLSGARRLAFYCAGQGSPTVIFEAGLGMSASVWRKVQPAIAARTTACAYDRAGYGHSDAGPMPRDAAHVVADLQAGLKAIGLRGPYVLVAHSLGAYDAQLFANLHRREVAGMVLVDPEVDGAERPFRRASPAWAKIADRDEAENRTCIGAAAEGRMRPGDPAFETCGSPPANSPLADRAMAQAVLSEDDSQLASFSQVRATRRSYGALPLIVLTAGVRSDEAALPAADRAALERVWLTGHEHLAHLSSVGVDRVIDGSPHLIPFARPDAVIGAVSEALAQTAAGKGP